MDIKKLKIVAANGTFTFDIADATARDLAQSATDTANSAREHTKKVTLLAANWQPDAENDGQHYQPVDLDVLTDKSKVNIELSKDDILIMQDKVITFNAINKNGAVQIIATGDKPTRDYTVQLSIKEVVEL